MDHLLAVGVLLVVATFVVRNVRQRVRPRQLAALQKGDHVVIDVRSAGEFATRHIEGAINVPLNELASRIGAVAPEKGTALLLHCMSGARSQSACRLLKTLGYQQIANLGGYGRAARLLGRESAACPDQRH